jgi:hypothetical protein
MPGRQKGLFKREGLVDVTRGNMDERETGQPFKSNQKWVRDVPAKRPDA